MRTAIFFDGKNFYSGYQSRAAEFELDFEKMAVWLTQRAEGVHLWGAYYYVGIETGQLAENAGQRNLTSFLNALEIRRGFVVKRYPRKARITRCPHCKAKFQFTQEKEVDTTMVADMLRLAAVNAFDSMILVSGDQDHAPAVEGVQLIGKRVFVATWGGRGLSPRIRKAAFDHIDLMQGLSEFGKLRVQPADAQHVSTKIRDVTFRTDDKPNDDGATVFLQALKEAETVFKGGFVGVNFFLKKWRFPELKKSAEVRGRLLEKLVRNGRVEKYTTEKGEFAIRTVNLLGNQK